MKKILKVFLISLVMILGITGCSDKKEKLVVGATSVPHAEILKEVVSDLKKKDINLEILEFSNYSLLNNSLSSGRIDANFFQHTSYLNNYVEETGEDLVSIGPIHNEPMGIYSKKIKSLDEIPDGTKVTLPNDVTNAARALLILQSNGIIKLKEGIEDKATIFDIEENPKNLKITEIDSATLPRTLDDVDISIINTNYALEAGFNPTKDALSIEEYSELFNNILVIRGEDKGREDIKALYEALTTDKVRKFIQEKYKGEIIPAF